MHLLVNTASGDLLKNKNKKKFITNAAGFKGKYLENENS